MEFCCFVFTFFEKRCNKQRKHARDHSQVLAVSSVTSGFAHSRSTGDHRQVLAVTVRAPVLLVSRSAPCLLFLLQKVAPGGCINPGLASPNGREVPQALRGQERAAGHFLSTLSSCIGARAWLRLAFYNSSLCQDAPQLSASRARGNPAVAGSRSLHIPCGSLITLSTLL